MTHGEMIRMREAGFMYREIAEKSGIPYGTVRSRLQRWGVKPQQKVVMKRDRRPTHDVPRWLLDEMYWSCSLSTVEIAYELCLSTHTVNNIMRRLGVPRRGRGESRRLYLQKNPTEGPPPGSYERAMKAADASVRARAERKRKHIKMVPPQVRSAERGGT